MQEDLLTVNTCCLLNFTEAVRFMESNLKSLWYYNQNESSWIKLHNLFKNNEIAYIVSNYHLHVTGGALGALQILIQGSIIPSSEHLNEPICNPTDLNGHNDRHIPFCLRFERI